MTAGNGVVTDISRIHSGNRTAPCRALVGCAPVVHSILAHSGKVRGVRFDVLPRTAES